MKPRITRTSIASLFLAAGLAQAAITVTAPSGISATATQLSNGKWEVNITQTSGSITVNDIVEIRGQSTSDIIESIRVHKGSLSQTTLTINIRAGASQTLIGAIEEIWVEDPQDMYVRIKDIHIPGHLGSASPTGSNRIEVAQIDNLFIGGNWYADVVVDNQFDSTLGTIVSIILQGNWYNGGLWQNVKAVGSITVSGSILGSSSEPIEIWALSSINTIQAQSIQHARIGSNTVGFSGNTFIFNLITTNGGFVSSAPMTMANLGQGSPDPIRIVSINGDFDADITFGGAMHPEMVYDIAGEFASAGQLTWPATGLRGTVIVNSAAGSDQFVGSVDVGSLTLASNYTNLSSTFGGGSIGAAPFNFHQFTGPLPTSRNDLDCNPFHTEFVVVGNCETITDLNEAVIDHYGPVFVSGEGPHYRVEFLPAFFDPSTGPQWIDVTNQFKVDESRTATASNTSNRKVYIVPSKDNASAFNAAGRFRFRPIADKVKCANVNGTPNVAYQSSVVSGDLGNTSSGTQHHWYQFRVALAPCPPGSMLFEGNQVNASDLAAWINNPFEVNMDGRICSQDFALMSSAYEPE